jgi:hypothetical protein
MGRNEDEVRRLVAPPEEPRGFHAACEQSGLDLIDRQLNQAIDELSRNPHCVDTAFALQDFRKKYSAVPSVKLDTILRKAWEAQ